MFFVRCLRTCVVMPAQARGGGATSSGFASIRRRCRPPRCGTSFSARSSTTTRKTVRVVLRRTTSNGQLCLRVATLLLIGGVTFDLPGRLLCVRVCVCARMYPIVAAPRLDCAHDVCMRLTRRSCSGPATRTASGAPIGVPPPQTPWRTSPSPSTWSPSPGGRASWPHCDSTCTRAGALLATMGTTSSSLPARSPRPSP